MAQFFVDSLTQTAGTAIQVLVPPSGDGIPIIRSLIYTSGSTAHTLTVLRPIGSTTLIESATSGSVLTLQSTNFGRGTDNVREVLAANDYLVWENRYGGYHFDTVSSISGSAVTMTNALPQEVAYGGMVWGCYELGRSTHYTVSPPVSATTTMSGISAGFGPTAGIKTSRSGAGDPLIVSSNNITAAGTIVQVAGDYVEPSHTTTT